MGICRRWIIQDPGSKENKKILDTALTGFVGSTFEPIAVAVQVVYGVNYIFLAKSITATLPPKNGLSKIYVTVTPANQEPRLINIETIV